MLLSLLFSLVVVFVSFPISNLLPVHVTEHLNPSDQRIVAVHHEIYQRSIVFEEIHAVINRNQSMICLYFLHFINFVWRSEYLSVMGFSMVVVIAAIAFASAAAVNSATCITTFASIKPPTTTAVARANNNRK